MSNDKDKQHSKPAEGFEATVERLEQDTPPDNGFEPVLSTDSTSGQVENIQIIKKRSLAGLLGLLFGTAALGGLGYWYYLQNGWQWPPQASGTRVKQADLKTLEKRLRADWQQQLQTTTRQATEPLTEQLYSLQNQLQQLQARLDALPAETQTAENPATGTTLPNEQLASLPNRLQQLQAQVEALQTALEQSRTTSQTQLAQLQQRLETLSATQTSPAMSPQAVRDLTHQLAIQQAANALHSAKLALNIQRQPAAAAQALRQAATYLQTVPEAAETQHAIEQAAASIEQQLQQPDTIGPALAEAMRAIGDWHWQPPASTTDQGENKKDWLSQLIVIKKIDQPQQAALTLAEEETIKRRALDALAAASLARHSGDQTAWQQSLAQAIATLQTVTGQPTLNAVIGQLEHLKAQNITPDWPNLNAIAQALATLAADNGNNTP